MPDELDLQAFESRYRELEAKAGAFTVGEAIRWLAGLPMEQVGWDNVITNEVRRCVALYERHYKNHEGPAVITVGRRPLQISHSHDELNATIGFVQGVTFAVALLEQRGLSVERDEPGEQAPEGMEWGCEQCDFHSADADAAGKHSDDCKHSLALRPIK
jgi:hypothetical protein